MTQVLLLIGAIAIGLLLYRNVKANKQMALENRAAGDAFLKENGSKDTVETTGSGLQFEVLQSGNGNQHPTATSKVTVHYHGTLIDGRVFDSSVERNDPATFPLNQVIKGWTEGVQLMVVGEKRRLFIPADLAYGDGSAGMVTPGSVLIFDIELLAIE